MVQLVDLDAVVVADPGIADVDDGEPAVAAGRAGAAGQPEMDLVDEAGIVAARVGARDHAAGRREDRSALGHAEAVGDLGDRALDRARDAVGEVGRGDRAAVRVARPADHAVLADQHLDPPEAAGIGRHGMIGDAVVDADHRGAERAGLAQVEPARLAVRVVAQVDQDPGLLGADLDRDLERDAVGHPRKRVVAGLDHRAPARQPADRLDHALLGIVEPVLGVLRERVPADLLAQRQQLALADPRRAERRQVVAPPLLGHADPGHAHADDVADVPVVALDRDPGKDQRALLVDVAGVADVGGRLRVAAVGLVRLAQQPEAMHARLVDQRHDDALIGRVRVAVIGRVVEEGIAAPELGMERLDRAGHQVRARS